MKTLVFTLSSIALILQSLLLPHLTLFAFAPWIAFVILTSSFKKTLYLSALSGIFIDLLVSDPSGVHAINHTLTAACLYPFRNWFFSQNPIHLSLFTIPCSFFSTLLQMFLLFLFDRRIPFAGKWILVDVLGMPLVDGVYALLWIAAPLKLSHYWSLSWTHLKRTLFPT
jgi:cell shape-determining protein MreD